MAGRPTSSGADSTTIARLKRTATQEGRTQSQITASSLRLYLGLPEIVRAALRDVDVLGTPEEQHNMSRAIARSVVSTQYEVTRRRAVDCMRFDNEDLLETDEAILIEAVRATAKDC